MFEFKFLSDGRRMLGLISILEVTLLNWDYTDAEAQTARLGKWAHDR